MTPTTKQQQHLQQQDKVPPTTTTSVPLLLPLSLIQRIRQNRWIVYAYCFTVVSLTAGTVYGWPALRQELRREDDDDNNNNDNGRWASETALGAAFTAGAWSTQGLRFFTGVARDRFGTSIVTTVCLLAVAAGAVGIATCTSPPTLALSLFCQGIGSGVQLCVQPVVAQLFPTHSGAVLASLSGAFQISGLVYLVVTALFQSQRQAGFLSYAFLVVALAVMALCLLPRGLSQQKQQQQSKQSSDGDEGSVVSGKSSQEKHNDTGKHLNNQTTATAAAAAAAALRSDSPIDSDHEKKVDGAVVDSSAHPTLATEMSDDIVAKASAGEDEDDEEEINKKNETNNTTKMQSQQEDEHASSASSASASTSSAWDHVFTWKFVLLVQWFSFVVTPNQYYIGSLGFQLEEKGDESGQYSDLYSIIYGCAAALSPAGGFLADRYSLGLAQGLATALSAISFFWLATEGMSLSWHTVGLTCNATGRMWVFATFFAHVGQVFGYQHFGTLAGLGLLLSALVSLLQYPLLAAAAHGNATAMNLMCGCLLTVELVYCYWLHRQRA